MVTPTASRLASPPVQRAAHPRAPSSTPPPPVSRPAGHSTVSTFQAARIPPAEVHRLQEQLNQYRGRSVPPLAAVPVNSNYDPATRSAVRDYQRVNRLPVTGETSAALQTHLQLRNDPAFRHLGTTTQDDVLGRVMSAPTTEARGNLVRLATEPSFSQLNGTHQGQMLRSQFVSQNDARSTDGLIQLARSPQFLSLNDATRSAAIGAYGLQSVEPTNIPRFNAMVTHPNFGRMGVEQQAAAISVFSGATPAGQTAFNDLLAYRPEVLPSVLPHLAPMGSGMDIVRQTMSSTLQEIDNPSREINQGADSGYCPVTNMTHRLATENPGEYARLVSDLALTGNATLADGRQIAAPPAGAIVATNTGRSFSENLLQGALYNHGRALPVQTDVNGFGQAFDAGVRDGLAASQQRTLVQSMFNRPALAFATQGAAIARLNRGLNPNDHVMAGLDFRNRQNHTLGHEVQVLPRNQTVGGHPQDPAFVYYRDPMGVDAERINATMSPRSEAATPTEPSNGLRRMPRAEFESALRNLVID